MSDQSKDLAGKMVEKLKKLRYSYPDTNEALNNLQKSLQKSMIQIHDTLSSLPDKDRDILTLLIISEIHKSVDEVFQSK